MKAKKSPFTLKIFFLLKHGVEFIPPVTDEGLDIPKLVDSYLIDINFTIQDSQKPFYQIFVKIEINFAKQKQLEYSIFSEGFGVFEFDKSIENNEIEKGNFIYYSSISICINGLRSIISNVTSHSPFGKYTFPTMDVNELLKDKKKIKPKHSLKGQK